MQLGTLDATIVSTSNLASFNDKLAAFSVPYVFKSVSCSFPVVDGAGRQEMADHAAARRAHPRARLSRRSARGTCSTASAACCIPTISRGSRSARPTRCSRRHGARSAPIPTPLPFPEVFNAAAAGRDRRRRQSAHQHPDVPLVRSRPSTCRSPTRPSASACSSSTSRSCRSCPRRSRTSILKAAAESIKANRASEADLNKKAEAFLRTQGVTFDTPNQDEFRAKLTPVFEEAKKRFGAELLDRIAAAQTGC